MGFMQNVTCHLLLLHYIAMQFIQIITFTICENVLSEKVVNYQIRKEFWLSNIVDILNISVCVCIFSLSVCNSYTNPICNGWFAIVLNFLVVDFCWISLFCYISWHHLLYICLCISVSIFIHKTKTLLPSTPLTGRKYLKDKEAPYITPVTTATQSVSRLQGLLAGRKAAPSEILQEIFK